jgi:hypothetical protein
MPGINFSQPFQRKGRTGTVAQQTLQTLTLVRLDANLGIDRKAAAVFPRGHYLRIVCRQQSAAHGHLHLADGRCIQATGRVKRRATLSICLENAIHHDAVEVQMGVEQRPETVDEDHGAEAGRCTGAQANAG